MNQPDRMPPRINRAFAYIATNAFSYQIAVTSPMILFARDLGASPFVIGILTGVLPLLILLQLPMARHFARIGYKELYVPGWAARTAAVFGMAVLPLGVQAGWLSNQAAIVALVALVTWFSLMRGIASGAWLPWVAAIIPPRLRVQFISMERIFNGTAAVAGILFSAAVLAVGRTLDAYFVVFGAGAIAGVASIYFLRQIPAPKPDPDSRPARTADFVRSALRDETFTRFIALMLVVQLVLGAMPTFTLVFAREGIGMDNGAILFVSAGSILAGVLAVQVVRRQIDRRGSLAYLWRALAWWFVSLLLWLLVSMLAEAGSATALATALVAVTIGLLLGAGFFNSMFDLASMRMLMTMAGHRPDNAQMFALNTVATNLAAFVAPVMWGALLDLTRGMSADIGPLHVTNFSLFFALQCVLLISVVWALRRIREPQPEPL